MRDTREELLEIQLSQADHNGYKVKAITADVKEKQNATDA